MLKTRLLALATLLLLVSTHSLLSAADDDVPRLINQLDSSQSDETRLEALGILIKSKSPELKSAFDAVRACIKDEDGEIRAAALNTAAVIGMIYKLPCPREVVETAFHDDPATRHLGSSFIGVFDEVPAELIPLLLRAIEHEDSFVRQSVAAPLGQSGSKDERTAPALKKAIKDKEISVRLQAYSGLIHATGEYEFAIPFWVETSDGCHDNVPYNPETGEGDMYSEEHETFEGVASASSLRHRGGAHPKEVGTILLKLLGNESPKIRRSAARALGGIVADHPETKKVFDELRVPDALQKLRSDREGTVRVEAATAIREYTKGRLKRKPPETNSEKR